MQSIAQEISSNRTDRSWNGIARWRLCQWITDWYFTNIEKCSAEERYFTKHDVYNFLFSDLRNAGLIVGGGTNLKVKVKAFESSIFIAFLRKMNLRLHHEDINEKEESPKVKIHVPENKPQEKDGFEALKLAIWFIKKVGNPDLAEKAFRAAIAANKELS